MKTEVIFTSDVHQTSFRKGDVGYIDGYVRGGDDRPCAVVILEDGHIGLAPVHSLKACGFTAEPRHDTNGES